MNTTNINRLLGSRCYLAGAMDRVADGGVIWRQKVTPFLHDIGVLVLDPCNKPIDIAEENADDRKLRHQLKANGKFSKISEYMKIIRQVDLRMVDIADFLIICIDVDVHACGTYEELFWANRQKKPILVWVPQGKKQAPDWLFGSIPHTHIFSKMSSLIKYLGRIDSAPKVRSLKRWVFFNYDELNLPDSVKNSGRIYGL